jgi:hypothetical protein
MNVKINVVNICFMLPETAIGLTAMLHIGLDECSEVVQHAAMSASSYCMSKILSHKTSKGVRKFNICKARYKTFDTLAYG